MIKKTKTALGLVAALGAAVLTSAPVNADQISDLNARIAKLESAEAVRSTAADNGNMVFFRGGYARNDSNRYGDILTDTAGAAGQSNGSHDAWYFGAGFDFALSDDAFGFHDGTEILAELMFEYKEFDRQNQVANPLQTVVGTVTNATHDLTIGAGSVTVSQFTLAASPKVKFMKGSKFRPWIVPVGFAMHVISPPSDGVTVLEPSMHFALGADYNVWRSIYVGADFRYNLTIGENLDGTSVGGLTTGGYVGIGF